MTVPEGYFELEHIQARATALAAALAGGDETVIGEALENSSLDATVLLERLETVTRLNDGLSKTVIGMSDRLEESKRELLATGWDECAKSPARPDPKDNPYRKPVPDLSGALFCKTDEEGGSQ